MRLLAYCVMPNHFHLLLWPRDDGDLSRFMRLADPDPHPALARPPPIGRAGAPLPGAVQVVPGPGDDHFLAACRYVERNALRAGLVDRAEDWRWGSLARPTAADPAPPAPLSHWPIPRPAAGSPGSTRP